MDLENLLELSKVLRLERSRAASGNLVDVGESMYNCFGCSSRGDLLNLCLELGEARGEDYSELEEFIWQNEGAGTLEKLCTEDLVTVPVVRKERMEARAAALYPESEYAPFQGKIPAYAAERGLPDDVCRAWDLGDDPEEGRLMFPIRDICGNLVGLKGRTYRGHKSKYFPYLDWGQGGWFYGEHMLRPEEEDPRIVIVEGEIDVIKVWMAGFSCLGIMGGMATSKHRRKLETLARPLVLMPDDNETGDRWSQRLGDQMKNIVNVFDVFLDGGDPGERSPEELRELIDNASLRL
jgi:DNA primase